MDDPQPLAIGCAGGPDVVSYDFRGPKNWGGRGVKNVTIDVEHHHVPFFCYNIICIFVKPAGLWCAKDCHGLIPFP